MTKHDPALAYDDDFYAWTQEQAAALRQLPTDVVGHRVDIAHVAEEIEDLGKRDLREVCSFLRRLMEHLIKIDACPSSPDVPHWRSETLHFAMSALDAYTRSMRQLIDLDGLWQRSILLARSRLREIDMKADAPTTCPFNLDQLLSDDFDLDAALAKLTASRLPASEPRDTPLP